MSECYYCHKPATGEHKIIELGQYDKGTRDKKVDLCKPCYDDVVEKKRNEARQDRFKYNNQKRQTKEQEDADRLTDYKNSVV